MAKENTDKTEAAMDSIWNNMKEMQKYFIQIRNKLVQARADRFMRKEKISPVDIDAKEGDLSFFIDPVSKQAVMCRIVNVKHARAVVFLCDSLEYKKVPISSLRILINERPENEARDLEIGDEDDDVMNEASSDHSKADSSNKSDNTESDRQSLLTFTN